MKCNLCFKNISPNQKNTSKASLNTRKSEIQSLKTLINEEQIKLNLNLAKLTPPNNNIQSENSQKLKFSSQYGFLTKLDKITKKQNVLIKIKSLQQKIKARSFLLQQQKSQRNQKLIKIQKIQKSLQDLKQDVKKYTKEQTNKLKTKIQTKKQVLKNLNQTIKRYFQQTIIKDLTALWQIQECFITFQRKAIFEIKKVQQLEYLSNLKPQDWMAQSYIELQNLEQVYLKRKTSQKGVHIFYQNILVLCIISKIFNLWLPYPISCQINFSSSKLKNSMGEIRICGKKMIDFGRSNKLSNNIFQFFPEEMKKTNSDLPQQTNEQQNFELFQNDESQEIYNRKYQLNKSFINYLQVNIEFLCTKYGIQTRPLVILEMNLINRIVKQYRWRNLWTDFNECISCPVNVLQKSYNSMLKEIKLSQIQESWEVNRLKIQKQIQKVVEQYEMEEDFEYSDNKYESENVRSESSSYWSSIKQSVYEIIVPESLQKVYSNDTDNDEFQQLTL